MGYERAEDWTDWYFLGFATLNPRKIEFDPKQVQFLLSEVEAQKVVAGLAPLDPRHLITNKGATAWQVLFVYALLNDKESLAAVSEGRALLLAPASLLRKSLSSHINWPEQVLKRYRLEPRGRHPLILPFIVHQSAPKPRDLQRSLRSPGGELEIFGVVEFSESEPEKLLYLVQTMAQEIDQQNGNA